MPGDRAVLLHMSDLHFGPPLVPGAPEELRREVERHRPDLVVVSGDLTQRAKPRQFRAAAVFLRGLGVPVFAIPGNHDIPLYPVHRRLFTPYRQFCRNISGEREPTAVVGPAALAALDTTSPYLGVVEGHGWLGRVDRWGRRISQLPPGKIRIAVAHHPLVPPPDGETKHLLRGAKGVAERLAREGCRLVLGGHLHVSFLRDAGEVWPAAEGLWAVQSGSSASDRGRHPDRGVRSYSLVVVDPKTIVIERWRTEGGAFSLAERREVPA